MRQEFDLSPSLLYLNAANQSICPRQVREAISRYHREYEANPTAGLSEAWGHLWQVQNALAGFLGADVKDLFLRTNVTSVLNTFVLGTPLPKGSEILVGELEYGAIVNICRLRAQRDELSLRVLKMPTSLPALRKLTPESLGERILSQLGPRTGMVLLSHVLGGTGLVLPLAEIAAETRRRNIFLVVDGAYAPGAMPVHFAQLDDVDFYGCSLYKWMLGPKGTAFGWVAQRHQDLLRPINAGWSTFEAFGPFLAHGGGSRFQEAFLMAGCHDFAPFRAVRETLGFWTRHGEREIQARMRSLQERLETGIHDRLGWPRLAAEDSRLKGPLLAFRVPSHLQVLGPQLNGRMLHELGIQGNTVCLHGVWHLVFSPHVHHSEEEMDEVVKRLERLR